MARPLSVEPWDFSTLYQRHFPSTGLEPGLPDVIRHTALRSSDFPLPASEDAGSDRPRNSNLPPRLPATVLPTSDLHRRSTLQPRLPISLRLASAASLRLCLPTATSNPSSTVRSFSKSSGPCPACAFNQPSNPTFPSTFDLRLQPTFRFRFRPDLRPSPPAEPPAMPSNRLPACAFRRSSGSTFQPTYLTCVSWSTFQLCFQT